MTGLQDSKNGVDNLCNGSDSSRPWLCSVQDRSGVLRVELQMEQASAIGFIDVGVFVNRKIFLYNLICVLDINIHGLPVCL